MKFAHNCAENMYVCSDHELCVKKFLFLTRLDDETEKTGKKVRLEIILPDRQFLKE